MKHRKETDSAVMLSPFRFVLDIMLLDVAYPALAGLVHAGTEVGKGSVEGAGVDVLDEFADQLFAIGCFEVVVEELASAVVEEERIEG